MKEGSRGLDREPGSVSCDVQARNLLHLEWGTQNLGFFTRMVHGKRCGPWLVQAQDCGELCACTGDLWEGTTGRVATLPSIRVGSMHARAADALTPTGMPTAFSLSTGPTSYTAVCASAGTSGSWE